MCTLPGARACAPRRVRSLADNGSIGRLSGCALLGIDWKRQEVTMKVPRKALCILIVGFGVSAPALAQSGGARLGPASGGGVTLPGAGRPGRGRSDVGLQLGATQPGWGRGTGTEARPG